MDHTQVMTQGERPSLGALVLDDGTLFVLNTDFVIGRNPEGASSSTGGATAVALSEAAGRMSRAHAEIRLIDWDVVVVDLGSLNGTYIRPAGSDAWQHLEPQRPYILEPEWEVAIGSRVLTFHSPHSRF